jgi:hypothetical protein
MKLKPTFFLIYLITFFSYGQGLTIPQWKELELYNTIPDSLLLQAEKELEYTIAPKDCYKFIHNADSTKFIALFVNRADGPGYKKLTRFGGAFQTEMGGKGNYYYGYVLWGMRYEGKWYFDKDDEHKFYSENTKSAKNDLLIERLTYHKFFPKGKSFWKGSGGNMFGMMEKRNPYAKEYPGVPELVARSKTRAKALSTMALNEQTQAFACTYQDSLWNALHTAHPLNYAKRYKGKYMEDHCMVLYNPEGTGVLMPLLYYNDKGEIWLQYFYLNRNGLQNSLYKWNKFEHKQVNRPAGDESLEAIYDIRTIIPNWGWGTQNMISTASFWEDNFNGTDLIAVP